MVFKSYKEESRKNYGHETPKDEGICIDQIRLGCEMRSADALESIKTILSDFRRMSNADRFELDVLRRSNLRLKRQLKKIKDEIQKPKE